MATKYTDLKAALNRAKHRIAIIDDTLSIMSKNIDEKTADFLVDDLADRYGQFINSLQHDHQDRNGTIIYKDKTDEGYRIVIEGPQVIYDEFGTGTEGANSPHPDKEKYNLEPYNSGFYIKTDKNGNKYWTYYSDDIDRYVTSHGVPAGHFMYDTLMYAAENIGDLIMFEEGLKAAEKIAKGK